MTGDAWAGFPARLLRAAAGLVLAAYALAVALDPYGGNPLRLPLPRALMDLNQRTMLPQVVRAGGFDGAVLGTSTVKLLAPEVMDEAFGGRFVNLAMNASTPWEQMQMAGLLARRTPGLRTLVWGLEPGWCAADAEANKLTPRGFPAWLYDENPWNDLAHLFDTHTLEIVGRRLLNLAGLMPARMRADGFDVFTPPEETYDLARARAHIARFAAIQARAAGGTPEAAPSFPALPWLDEALSALDPGTSVLLVFPPHHVAVQPAPATAYGARLRACRGEVVRLARAHGAAVADFSIPSAFTSDDTLYWDALHWRLPLAPRLAGAYARAIRGEADPGGIYELLMPPTR